ncbi:MAG: TetR/AcrR family transcriptional regulator [Solirubrobacterales bacterium]|nr:TetR/AcrR family transcriptional regulator [Solirubrobacterales bacterium]
MSTPPPVRHSEEEHLGDAALHELIADELGDRMAAAMRSHRELEEARYRAVHPEEGLRERKRRLTRQLISDAATALFAIRGFDNVKVAEVADRVGVSEKTVYNYFPTKESMVLDTADETIERLARALRERRDDESLTDAMVRSIREDMARFDEIPEELVEFVPMFVEMVENTPALRAAWLELHDRLSRAVRDELAVIAGVDPQDPEPTAAGRALAGLADVVGQSRVRHIREGKRGVALRDAVAYDLERGGRLLEAGLWSFGLLARGARAKQQAQAAAAAAEETRAQVLAAMRQARNAWAQVRGRKSRLS